MPYLIAGFVCTIAWLAWRDLAQQRAERRRNNDRLAAEALAMLDRVRKDHRQWAREHRP